MAWYDALRDDKALREADIIVRAFAAERGIEIGGVPAEDGRSTAFMYATDRFLAREQYLREVGGTSGRQDIHSAHRQRGILDILHENGFDQVEVRRVVRDIVVVLFNPDRQEEAREEDTPDGNGEAADGNGEAADGNGEAADGERRDALFLINLIQRELGPGIATLDHVVTAAPEGSGCPATEPQETYDKKPYPPVCPGKAGDGVRIYVADTGIVKNSATRCPWLEGVTGDDDPSVEADDTILPYGGHGTFVAGVIRSVAPGADIEVRAVFDIAGSALESEFVPKLNEGFGYGAEIFHVTVASPTKDYLPLMAFEAWMEDLRQHKGVVCVVPAGNYDSRLPHWPAAFPELISVGALATDWRSRAYFSDYGGWVDVYAPGQDLVNAFATGTFTCQVAPYEGQERTFSGMAQWSGTSFSTPIVTGLIAARMARCGESGHEAAAALLAQARAQAIPGVGPVLYPCCDNDEPCGRCGCHGRHDHGHGCGCGCGGDCGCERGRGGGCGCEHGRGGGCGCERGLRRSV